VLPCNHVNRMAMMPEKRLEGNLDPSPGLAAALAALPLAVAVIQSAFRALLIPTIRAAVLLEPDLPAALHTAIAASPVTVLADQEQSSDGSARMTTVKLPVPLDLRADKTDYRV
jgi:hypothetical protein